MKHVNENVKHDFDDPAAFRRLCVETKILFACAISFIPAAFRRLCVETQQIKKR